jgi:hypothetical protein
MTFYVIWQFRAVWLIPIWPVNILSWHCFIISFLISKGNIALGPWGVALYMTPSSKETLSVGDSWYLATFLSLWNVNVQLNNWFLGLQTSRWRFSPVVLYISKDILSAVKRWPFFAKFLRAGRSSRSWKRFRKWRYTIMKPNVVYEQRSVITSHIHDGDISWTEDQPNPSPHVQSLSLRQAVPLNRKAIGHRVLYTCKANDFLRNLAIPLRYQATFLSRGLFVVPSMSN